MSPPKALRIPSMKFRGIRTLRCFQSLIAILCLFLTGPSLVAQQTASAQKKPIEDPDLSRTIVVTTDRVEEKRSDVPAGILVITGEELELRGARSLAEALESVPGLEVAHQADEGPLGSSAALWGLREFDAYSVLVDGVPVGGVYNPNTAFIPIEEIDRIEVQKGPNAVLYGQTAFAGIIHVVTKVASSGTHGFVATGGGSHTSGHIAASVGSTSDKQLFRVSGSIRGSQGWQDRAGYREERMGISYLREFSSSRLRLSGQILDRTQGFGAPFPRDGARVAAGLDTERNYAPHDAEIADRGGMASLVFEQNLGPDLSFVNTTSFTVDHQNRTRGFLNEFDGMDEPIAEASGSSLRPEQFDVFEDAHLRWRSAWNGHESILQVGGSYQYGKLDAEARLFDYTVNIENPNPPSSVGLPAEEADFFNRRDFAGLYLHEELIVNPYVSFLAGVRLDHTRERQEIGFEGDEEDGGEGDQVVEGEVGMEVEIDDEEGHTAASYRAAAVFHVAPGSTHHADFFLSFNHAFKPAAVNFGEPEAVRPILDPETADAFEGGIKVSALDARVFFEMTAFQMNFKNLVVSEVRNGQVILRNAGEERFRGVELSGNLRPIAGVPFSFSAGYSYHRPIFTSFSTLNEEGELLVLDGKTLELAPTHLGSFALRYGTADHWGFFADIKGAGKRPVNRRNTVIASGYVVADAGIWYTLGEHYRLLLNARNLGDSRHIAAESELADAQVYLHPPGAVEAELRVLF